MTTIIRRLTLRTAGLTKKSILAQLPETGSVANLIKVAGETTEAKVGQTDKGEYIRLLGNFFAENMVTGERFQSSQCILPTFIAEPMAAALKVSQSVEFAIQIDATENEDSAVGYVFSVKSLTQAEPTDKMKRLMLAAGITDKPAEKAADKPAEEAARGDAAEGDAKAEEPPKRNRK